MGLTNIKVGILTPSAEISQLLRSQVEATRLASVRVEVGEYCTNKTDGPTRKFLEARPDIIILDMEDRAAAVQSLTVLHSVLPKTWLLVSSAAGDPGLIIETVRAGAREFLSKPTTPASLSQAFLRYGQETRQQSAVTAADGKIYCVTSAKSGAGATTVAINLATALADAPNTRVALVDLSRPLGDAAAYLNIRAQFNVTDALRAADRLDAILLGSYMNAAQGVSVLAGPEVYQPGEFADIEGLPRLLEVATGTYTHTVVDLPAALERQQLEMLREICTAFLLVVTPELPAVWRADRLLRYLTDCGLREKVRVIINRSTKEDQMDQADIKKALDLPVFWRLPNDYGAAMEAISAGKPVVSINGSHLSRGCRELAQRLTGTPTPEKRRGLRGLFAA